MKQLIFIWSFVTCVLFVQAQKGTEDHVMDKIGKWSKSNDARLDPIKSLPKIISRLDRISTFFLSAYPEPRGTAPKWYRTVDDLPLLPGGPQVYNFQTHLHYWYCNKNTDQLELTGETGNWGNVHVNSLQNFLWQSTDTLLAYFNGQTMYVLPNAWGKWKGYDFYEFDCLRSVLITHNGRVPWKVLTQRQYLQSQKDFYTYKKKENAAAYKEVFEKKEAQIKEMQESKEWPADFKAEMLNTLKKDLEEWQQMASGQTEKINLYYDSLIKAVDGYVATNPHALGLPAVIEQGYQNSFAGKFSTIEQGGLRIAVLDPAYFDKKFASDVPQLMVLAWSWEDNPPSLYWKEQIEKKFPVEKLQAMLDK